MDSKRGNFFMTAQYFAVDCLYQVSTKFSNLAPYLIWEQRAELRQFEQAKEGSISWRLCQQIVLARGPEASSGLSASR